MPYISKHEYDRLLSKDSAVDTLLAVHASMIGDKKGAKALFKIAEEKMKAQLGVDNLDEWADKEMKKLEERLGKKK